MNETNLSTIRGQISSGQYALEDMQNVISALYIQGQITQTQYAQMMSDAATNVDAGYTARLDVGARLTLVESALAELLEVIATEAEL